MSSRISTVQLAKPVGNSPILIFDIDNCLYFSPELEASERNAVKHAYMQLSKTSETEWTTNLATFNLYRELFFYTFDIHPGRFAEEFDLPDFKPYLKEDKELRLLLDSIPLRKFCFTNGSARRASSVLAYLGIENQFEAVICTDIVDTEFISKPKPQAFKFVENILGISSKSAIHFYDDSETNVKAAEQLGWNSVLVNGDLKEHLKKHVTSQNQTKLELCMHAFGCDS